MDIDINMVWKNSIIKLKSKIKEKIIIIIVRKIKKIKLNIKLKN